jgi:hypothetical protein
MVAVLRSAPQVSAGLIHSLLWADAVTKKTLWERLDPVRRAQLLMVLLGLVLIAFLLVMLVLWGGRYVRRLARQNRPTGPSERDRWYEKPLASGERGSAEENPRG